MAPTAPTWTTTVDTRHPSTLGAPAAELRLDPGDLPPLDLHDLLRGGFVRVEAVPPRRREYPGETPVEGRGAVARWLALHDSARDLRAALRPGDGIGERQARRAIRSLFLYEHQLTPKTRRQARTVLWRRDRADGLPSFTERVRWTRCRCAHCQPRPARVLQAPRGAIASMAHAMLCGA